MSTPLHVLNIGNSRTDTSLIERQLCIRWPALILERVETVRGLQKALSLQDWDCVLCDMCSSSGYDAAKSLSVVRESTQGLPFFILSNIANFENATSLLKNGADDFIRKNDPERLVSAIEKVLTDASKTQEAEHEGQEPDNKLRQAQWSALIDTLPDLVWLKDRQGVYMACNHRFERYFGADENEIIGKTDYEFMDKEQADSYREQDEQAMATGKRSINEEEICLSLIHI